METDADDRAHGDGGEEGGIANRVSDGNEMEVEPREMCQAMHSSSGGNASGAAATKTSKKRRRNKSSKRGQRPTGASKKKSSS